MTIQDLGAIGEFLGGIAVVASVLYLAVQIRHGMHGYRSAITQEVTTHFSKLLMEVAQNRELAEVWTKTQTGEPLDEAEQRLAWFVTASFMIGYENMFYQHRAGMIDTDSYGTRRLIMARMIQNSSGQQWWNQFGKHQHPPEFSREVEQAVEDLRHGNSNAG